MSKSSRLSRLFNRSGRSSASIAAAAKAGLRPIELLEDRILFSHFRYSELHWNPGASSREVVFHMQQSYRRDYSVFGPAEGATGSDGFVKVGDKLDTLSTISFGDGQSQEVFLRITAVDLTQDLFVGTLVGTDGNEGLHHTYASNGNFTAFTTTCCRLSTLQNDHDDDYRIETTVNVGTGNSSPVSSLAPVVQVADNTTVQFQVPAIDPNGDKLHYRVATSTEADGLTTYTLPPGFAISASGQVTWDIHDNKVTTKPGDLWTAQVMVEDLDGSGNPKSKTPVDFIMQVVGTSTNQPPVFDSIPSQLKPTANQKLTFNVQVSDPNATDTVSVQPLNAPTGMTFASTTVAAGSRANAKAIQVSWTPTAAQAGQTFVVTFQATDNHGATAQASVTISPIVAQQSATAGGPYTINEGASLSLNASGSTGFTSGATYSWDVNGDGTFGDATGVSPTLTWTQLSALGINDGGQTFTAKVKITDGATSVTSPGTTITVKEVAPVVNAGPDKTTNVGTGVTLTGSFTHNIPGDQDTFTTGWTVKDSGGNTVATSSSLSFTFTPTAAGVYTATLSVKDDDGLTGTDSALINAGNVSSGPQIVSWTLVDADTDRDIETLTDGITLDLAKLPRRLNARANTSPTKVGSVQVSIDGRQHIEKEPPYAIFYDLAGDYAPGTFADGSRTLSAIAFTGPVGTGTAGPLGSIHINVINQPPAAQSAVTQFFLVNQDTGQDIMPLREFLTLDLSTLPKHLGIRVNTTGVVGSIEYVVDAHVGVSPTTGLKVGAHTITALPFSGPNATGTPGASKTLRIFIV